MLKKPMKGEPVPDDLLHKLRWPMFGSFKYDGIRCLNPGDGRGAITAKMKPIPNNHIREILSHRRFNGVDGEIVMGEPDTPGNFNLTQSAVMSFGGSPHFNYYVFDLIPCSPLVFKARLQDLRGLFTNSGFGRFNLIIVKQRILEDEEDLRRFEEKALDLGYEGVMLRDPIGYYKEGRCSINHQGLLKRKPFLDAEGKILSMYPQNFNSNEPKMNEMGLNKRSKKKAGMVEKDTLGGFILQTKWGELKCATGEGLTQVARKTIWDSREDFVGKYITFKYLPIGMKDKPRHPIFLRFRDERDIS